MGSNLRLGTFGPVAGALGAAGMLGNADVNERLAAAGQGGTAFAGRNPMMNFANGFGGGGGGNANLRIGGVFGTDVSFKIIQLNQEMVTIMTRMLAIMEGNRNPTQSQFQRDCIKEST